MPCSGCTHYYSTDFAEVKFSRHRSSRHTRPPQPWGQGGPFPSLSDCLTSPRRGLLPLSRIAQISPQDPCALRSNFISRPLRQFWGQRPQVAFAPYSFSPPLILHIPAPRGGTTRPPSIHPHDRADRPARLRGRDPGVTPGRQAAEAGGTAHAPVVADLRVAGPGCCAGVVLRGQRLRGLDPHASWADRDVALDRWWVAACAPGGEQGA